MKGVMNIELLGEGQYKEFKKSGIKIGKLKLPSGATGHLVAVGENETYLHCFYSSGVYLGVYKSDDENHLYQHILKLNT